MTNSGGGPLPVPKRLDTAEYRQAVSGGDTELAYTWKDKPHRLIYDLCSEVDHLRVALGRVDPEHGPEMMSRDQFADLLLDLSHRVRTGDSAEGFVEYLLPGIEGDEEIPNKSIIDAVNVRASYLVGNRDGQGGTVMFGVWANEPSEG